MIKFLNEDSFEYLLNICEKMLDSDITKLENIINKLDLLSINKNEIKYQEAYYSLNKNIFSTINENIILINDPYIYGNQKIYESKILKNPTYFDILVEASKSIIETEDYCHIYMKGLKKIKTESNINYYELILDSY